MRAAEYDHFNTYADYINRISGRDGKSFREGGQLYKGVVQSFKP